MEKYKKVFILITIVIGFSVGSLAYDNAVAVGEPFVQADAYGEFDYVKLSNREFTLYLTESNLHDRESLGWFSADYLEIDVIVVIDGIEYERSMFCHKGESSELEVESATIIFSFYMEEDAYTFNALITGIVVTIMTIVITGAILWMIDGVVQDRRIVTAGIKE